MKTLSDFDIIKMGQGKFLPDEKAVKKSVRENLKIQKIMPKLSAAKNAKLDLHNKTIEQAWSEINQLLESGCNLAQIITGASGVLKPLFSDWVKNATIASKITSVREINNGCTEIKIKKIKTII